uniref:Integrase, catalytic region, zinc finger, CCHC-type, peptidase aspartic, catalytic n=1 Tax=Tanacetum cinerariifolium TaxID=118510 RepID=A0A6L2NSD3_TANCI|nr:hypothetical protein [Tanacetum cinerariifolium]
MANVSNIISKSISIPNEEFSDDTPLSVARKFLNDVKTYNEMQNQIERLQAHLGDLKGKSMDTQCASDTLDPVSQKIDDEIVSLEFQVIPKVVVTIALSKPFTLNSEPSTKELTVMKNNKVIALGMFRINPLKTSRVENFVPNKPVEKFLGTVHFGNDHVAVILGYGNLQRGNILIVKSREELYFSNTSKTANVSKPISIPNEEFSDDTTPSVARKFLNEVKSTIVTLQHVIKQRMSLETHNWSSSAHQELQKIVKDEIFPIVNQVEAIVQNFEIQFLKEAAKFVGDFKSLAKEADESLAKHKTLELEIKRLFRAVDTIYENAKLRAQLFDKVSDPKDTTSGKSTNTKFAKQSILGKPPKVGKTYALSKPVTLNSISIPQGSKVVKNDKVIAPGMFRINPFKPSREENHVPHNVRATVRTNPITISQPPVITKKDKQKANVSINENQKKQKPKVKKTKNVGSIERLASPKPSNSRSCFRWSPTRRMFDLKGKIIAFSEPESQSDCSKGDNACTSNPLEPIIKRFPNSTFSLAGFGDLLWGNILITRVYFVEGLGHNLFSIGQFCDSDLEVAFRRNACFVRNLEGVDLLKGDRTTNLYTINLHEMASASLICLMARASSTKSWLWHQRLSHLNFDTINDLAKNNLVFAIATACFTQNHSIIHCRFNKTPYELINDRKPDISFLHVFGALCYLKNDREDIGKLGEKSDIGFFIGYSADSCTYRVFNQRTKKIIETMNVSFDELSAMAFEQRSELDLLFEAMYDDYIGGQPSSDPQTVSDAQAHLQQGNQIFQPETVVDNVPNAMFDANTFVNPFATPSTSAAESASSQYVDPSNMHTFYQPYPYEFQWTKHHPLEQVIREPSRPILTRNQLRSDGDMCMYALTMSTMEPKNVKEAMTYPAWIESMQEEHLQFKRFNVWVLVPAPDNITPLTLKWLFKNKHDEEQTIIRNKSRLVVRGYRQEEGIVFE